MVLLDAKRVRLSPPLSHASHIILVIDRGFSLKDETIEVKEIMEGQLPELEKLDLVHKKYTVLVRDYKRLERRLTETQKKQIEVRNMAATLWLPSILVCSTLYPS